MDGIRRIINTGLARSARVDDWFTTHHRAGVRIHEQKIAVVSATLNGGGAERVIALLANALCRKGYLVDLVLMKETGSYLQELDSGINVVNLDSSRALFSIFPLARYLRRARPAVLLSTQVHINVLSILACGIARVPLRLVIREASTPSVITKNQGSGKAWLMLKLLMAFYPRADRIIAPSKGVMHDLTSKLGLPAAKVTTIPNPLPLASIQQLAGRSPGHRWFEQDALPIILAVGRLSDQKDFRTLIRSFAKVCRNREARLVILGEGEDRRELQRFVDGLGLKDRVDLAGFVNNPFAYLKRSAVYVLSSPSEGLPNTLLEAMAVEIPVIATDCPSGPREILEGGRWGRLVSVGDVDAMATAIISALDGKVATAPLSVLEEKYGIENIVEEYLEVLTASRRDE